MRTTVVLNDELLRSAKKRAAEEGRTLKSVLEAALRAYLGGSAPPAPYRFRWRTEKGRLRPGIRIDDRKTLEDILEGRR